MAYGFESFCEDCRNAYSGTTGEANLEVIRQNLEKLIKENSDKVPEDITKELQDEVDLLKATIANEESDSEEINEGIEKVNLALQKFGQNLPQQGNDPSDASKTDDKSDEDDTVDGEYKEV